MAHWNYKMMRKNGQVAVHEVFYSDEGEIKNFTVKPVYPRAADETELAEEFERYRRALSEPVLDFASLEAKSEEQ